MSSRPAGRIVQYLGLVVQHPGRGLEYRSAADGADLAQFLGDDQIGPQLPEDIAVHPVDRVVVGPGLLDDGVNLLAVQVGKLPDGAAYDGLAPDFRGVVAGVGNSHHLVSQAEGIDDFGGAGQGRADAHGSPQGDKRLGRAVTRPAL